MVTEIDIEYLDLDGDGLPDAVRTVTTRTFGEAPDGTGGYLETLEELAWGLDDDGEPQGMYVTDTLYADLDHDGVPHSVETVEFGIPASAA